MSYKLIAEGTPGSLKNLGEYENHYEENSRGYLEVTLLHELAGNLVNYLDGALESAGVPEEKVVVTGKVVHIYFKKEIAPLVIIAAAIAGSFFLIALVVSWKLFKLTPAVAVGTSAIVFMAIIAGVLIVLYLISTRGKLAAGPVTVGGS